MQFHPKDLSELDDLTEEHLGFSALSEGLGFTKQSKRAPQRPVESHQPAAPMAKPQPEIRWSTGEATPWISPKSESSFDSNEELSRKAFSGIGAVAAGPARPAPSKVLRVPPPANLGTSVLSEPAAPRSLRAAACFFDFLIGFTPLGWWLSFRSQSLATFNQDRRSPLFLFALIFAVYFLLSESFGGQSLGKMLFNLHVVEDDKYQKPTGLSHAAKRIFFLVTGTCLGSLGLLSSFWDNKRRPWHDRFSGSIVRKKV
jgi:uncharacterized RDD family membrane protein YckC